MRSEDILLLVKAGYSRQEIDAMDQAQPAPAPVAPAPVAPAPVAPAADQAQPAPAADQVSPAPDSAPVTNDNNAILDAINALGAKMTAAMQAASLGAAMMQAPAGDTLESVMAQIIQPTAPTK